MIASFLLFLSVLGSVESSPPEEPISSEIQVRPTETETSLEETLASAPDEKDSLTETPSSISNAEVPAPAPDEKRDFSEDKKHCRVLSRSNQFLVRHTEPKGIGFTKGYTTLEGFVMANKTYLGVFPYVDARWHIFNDGKNAINIGLGARGISRKRFYGANIYYDYRQITERSFSQVSFGFETIGRRYDLFANGYIVVGKKDTGIGSRGYQFYHFQGHHLLLRANNQGALSGLDGTFRAHLLQKQRWDCYVDVGPYYYHGSKTSLFGGKTGIGAIISQCFFAEATLSYDHIFKWIGQGIGGFRFSLGSKIKALGEVSSCKKNQVLASRLMQIPKHNEIIVVNGQNSISLAINPATDQPYFFWFVNNLSSSLGTFESPYPTLAEAQEPSSPYDIIYAYTGDQTSKGMDQGIALKDFQQLWGAGISHSLPTTRGNIVIPALDSGYPKITNTAGAGVDLANFNTVSGILVDSAFTYGMRGLGISQANIINNIISNVNQEGGLDRGGIHLEGPGLTGTFQIANNIVQATDPSLSMIGIVVTPTNRDVCSAHLLQNNVQTSLKSAVMIQSLENSTLTTLANSNQVSSNSDSGFYLSSFDASRHEFSLVGNQYSSLNGSACLIEGNGAGSVGDGVLSNSQFVNSQIGLQIDCEGMAPLIDCTVIGNVFSNNQNSHVQAETNGLNHQAICLRIINNTCKTTAPSGDFFLKNDLSNSYNLIEFSGNTPNAYIDGTEPGSNPIFSFPICIIPD